MLSCHARKSAQLRPPFPWVCLDVRRVVGWDGGVRVFRHPLFWMVWLQPVVLFCPGALSTDGRILWLFWAAGALFFTLYLHGKIPATGPLLAPGERRALVLMGMAAIYLLTYPFFPALLQPEWLADPASGSERPHWVWIYGRPYFWLMDHSIFRYSVSDYYMWCDGVVKRQ